MRASRTMNAWLSPFESGEDDAPQGEDWITLLEE
jgi:hypothetical protein